MERRVGAALLLLMMSLAACAAEPQAPPDPELEAGRETYGQICTVCHGGAGEGGVGPNLTTVVATFPNCDTQVQWISLGSVRWKNEVGPTYGSQGREITGAMPSFEGTLTEGQIRQVAAFERHRYGGSSQTAALADCGLA